MLCAYSRLSGAIAAVSLSLAATITAAGHASAQGTSTQGAMGHGGDGETSMPMMSAGHGAVPAGVMGAHMVPAGKAMVGYSTMFMHMEGNRVGTDKVSPEEIATMPNRFSPPHAATYRVVPTSMDMRMHMFGVMLGLTNDFNVMLMGSHVRKEMDMTVFRGMMGTNVLGTTYGATEGLGDGSITGLLRLYDAGPHHVHLNLGLSLPIGSTTETVTMLSPMNRMMTMRASYGMQLGSGTVDALPGITYTGKDGAWSWGLTYRGRIPLEKGDEGWKFGDLHEVNGWLGYTVVKGITLTGRASGSTQGRIKGIDPKIQGAMPALDPDNYGGERVELFGGIEFKGESFGMGHTRLVLEAGAPVYEDLNGPQGSRDWMATLALRARF